MVKGTEIDIRKIIVKFLIIAVFTICILFIIMLISSNKTTATNVSGHITSNTTWNASQNPYDVVGQIRVDLNVTLTIEPGVIVNFNGDHGISVNGVMIAIGNKSNEITFTHNNSVPSPTNWKSIYVSQAGQILLNHCNISNAEIAIRLYRSANDSIVNTNISNCKYGIALESSTNTTILNVNFLNMTQKALDLHLNRDDDNYIHTINDCLIEGKPLYYIFEEDNVIFEEENLGQVTLIWCSNVTFSRCNITNNTGIFIYYTRFIEIIDCKFYNNHYGIYIYDDAFEGGINGSIFFDISDSTFTNNNYGIYFVNQEGNSIFNNTFIKNNHGIYFSYSQNNTIYHNNFFMNLENVKYGYYPETKLESNRWDNGNEGNYWDDYSGEDIGGGIGSQPYIIHDDDSPDNFPLLNPWNGSLPPDYIPPYLREAKINVITVHFHRDAFKIEFTPSEYVYFEIVIDTDGIQGFDNTSDTVISGYTMGMSYEYLWNGTYNNGSKVKDGEYEIQIMIWDKAGNPASNPHDAGSVNIIQNTDNNGVINSQDTMMIPLVIIIIIIIILVYYFTNKMVGSKKKE